jgi:hypothetical protein
MPLINRVGGGSGGDLQSQTKTPTTSSKTYYPDSGYDGFSSFTVGAIPSSYKYVTTTQGTKEWTPTTYDQEIASGTYCSGKQTIKGDTNLAPKNILNGETVFGVGGTALRTEDHLVDTSNSSAFLEFTLEGKVNSGDVVHFLSARRNGTGYVRDDEIYGFVYTYGSGYDSDGSITGDSRVFCGGSNSNIMVDYQGLAPKLFPNGTVSINASSDDFKIPAEGNQWTVIVTYGPPHDGVL